MTPIKNIDAPNSRSAIMRSKRVVGATYGIVGGLTFAITCWGQDGYILSQSHAYLPWFGLTAALVSCAAVGATVGWLTARIESSLFGVIFWLMSSLFFAWLVIAMPLQILPFAVSKINPQLGELINYQQEAGFMMRFGVALLWIMPFTLIIGVAQLPVTETAVFSTSFFGKVAPFFFCVIVMSMSGIFADGLVNAHFRNAIVSMDNTIQFVLDNQNNAAIDKNLARQMRVRSLSAVQQFVVESRYLFIGGYDETLGDTKVLIKFNEQWVNCNVIYSQPVFCKVVEK